MDKFNISGLGIMPQLNRNADLLAAKQRNVQPDAKGITQGARPLDETLRMKEAARQFESMLVHEMMKSMWSTVPKDGIISSSNEEDTFRDMMSDAVANTISEGKGMGVQEVVLKDMERIHKNEQSKK